MKTSSFTLSMLFLKQVYHSLVISSFADVIFDVNRTSRIILDKSDVGHNRGTLYWTVKTFLVQLM